MTEVRVQKRFKRNSISISSMIFKNIESIGRIRR